MVEPISDRELDVWRHLASTPGPFHLPKIVLRQILARLDRAEQQAIEAEAALWRIAPNTHTIGTPDPFEGPGETYADAYHRVAAECDALREALAENQSMAQTLQFYADRNNYLSPSTGFAAQYDPAPSEVALDQGRRARDALAARRSA